MTTPSSATFVFNVVRLILSFELAVKVAEAGVDGIMGYGKD